jgi:hypothetical protein
MNKLVVRGFLRWLDTASDLEIETRRQAFLEALEQFHGKDARADLRLGLRLIEEELAARADLRRARPEPSPPLEPREKRAGKRQPLGHEEGGGELPFEGVASAFHQPEWGSLFVLIAHGDWKVITTHARNPARGRPAPRRGVVSPHGPIPRRHR